MLRYSDAVSNLKYKTNNVSLFYINNAFGGFCCAFLTWEACAAFWAFVAECGMISGIRGTFWKYHTVFPYICL